LPFFLVAVIVLASTNAPYAFKYLLL